jgi:hypothetical protein
MMWFLVMYVCSGSCGGIDPGITGYVPQRDRIEIAMPSRDVCQQIEALNSGSECWARPAKQ